MFLEDHKKGHHLEFIATDNGDIKTDFTDTVYEDVNRTEVILNVYNGSFLSS
jgi:hypothetical protein